MKKKLKKVICLPVQYSSEPISNSKLTKMKKKEYSTKGGGKECGRRRRRKVRTKKFRPEVKNWGKLGTKLLKIAKEFTEKRRREGGNAFTGKRKSLLNWGGREW